MASNKGLQLEQWKVMANGRLAGNVYNRPGHRDGARIVTTPVVEVRLMGAGTWTGTYPVAFTESGSAYRLGTPAKVFGVALAKRFVRSVLPGPCGRQERPSRGQPDFEDSMME